MKKILLISIGSFLGIVILILSIGLFLYFKGPYFALKKIQQIASIQYHTHFDFGSVGLREQTGFFIKDIVLKHPQITLTILGLNVTYRIDWENKILEIQNIEIHEPHIHFHHAETTSTPSPKSQEPTALETFLRSPPTWISLEKMQIKNLSFFHNLRQNNPRGSSSALSVEIRDLDLNLLMNLNPGIVNLNVDAMLNQHILYKHETQAQILKLKLSKLDLKSVFEIKTDKNQQWLYSMQPLQLSGFTDQMEIHKKINHKKTLFLAIDKWQTQIQLKAITRSHSLFAFNNHHPQQTEWNLQTQFHQLRGRDFSQFLTSKNQWTLSTQGELTQASPSFQSFDLPFHWNWTLKAKGGPIQLGQEKPLLSIETKWINNLGRIDFKTEASKTFHFQAQTEIQNRKTELKGLMQSQLPSLFLEKLIKQKISGEIYFPFHILYEPKQKTSLFNLQVDAKMGFKNVHVDTQKIKLVGINGEIPIIEKINVDPTTPEIFSFQKLFHQNPFERVDYERIDPFVRSAAPINIDQIHWNHQSYGPFSGIIGIEQNFISLHRFSFQLQQGTANGEIFMDLYPKSRQLGFLGRLTNIDLAQILPPEYLPPQKHPLLFSARTGAILSITHKTLNGRMDVTHIGGPQLTAFINLIDPHYLDEKLNKIRSWLEMGSPTQIQLSFHEGTMDMDLNLAILGINRHQTVNGITIQSFIDKSLEPKKETK